MKSIIQFSFLSMCILATGCGVDGVRSPGLDPGECGAPSIHCLDMDDIVQGGTMAQETSPMGPSPVSVPSVETVVQNSDPSPSEAPIVNEDPVPSEAEPSTPEMPVTESDDIQSDLAPPTRRGCDIDPSICGEEQLCRIVEVDNFNAIFGCIDALEPGDRCLQAEMRCPSEHYCGPTDGQWDEPFSCISTPEDCGGHACSAGEECQVEFRYGGDEDTGCGPDCYEPQIGFNCVATEEEALTLEPPVREADTESICHSASCGLGFTCIDVSVYCDGSNCIEPYQMMAQCVPSAEEYDVDACSSTECAGDTRCVEFEAFYFCAWPMLEEDGPEEDMACTDYADVFVDCLSEDEI